ncbi:MAG: hypothetical protein IT242_07150, partial [Bacteroidia bacterium]|nr:hypothetical protein [Bacteroidia bacterium]
MKKKINRLIPGLLAGILTPALTFQLYVLLQHPDKNMRGVLGMFAEMHVLTHVISLAVIPNLAVFFL